MTGSFSQSQRFTSESVVPIKVFGLKSTRHYAQSVCDHLGIPLASHEEKYFQDGECYVKSVDGPEGNVRGHNVFVIQSLYSDDKESVADKFIKLAIMCGSLRTASAAEVVPVIPHLAFARQDRKTESRAPVTTKIISNMLESVGIDRILFMDVHNLSAEQNAFSLRCPVDNLECKNLHAEWFAEKLSENKTWKKLAVLSPDSGGYARTVRFRNALAKLLKVDIEIAILDKLRINGEVTARRIVGDIEGAEVIAYDDMISTGGSMVKACRAVEDHGGRLFGVCVTHGLFVGKADKYISEIDTHIVISDTVPPLNLSEDNMKKIHIVNTSGMVAEAIKKIHTGTGSISELLV